MPSGSRFTCGFLTAPENRNDPWGPTIKIAAAIVHGESVNRAPDPVVYVAGGFEGDAVRSLESLVDEHLTAYLQDRDVIVFDSRGAGLSEPVLECTQAPSDSDYGEYVVIGLTADRLSSLEACRQKLLGEGIDLSLYTVDHSAPDLIDLTTALGYKIWNLFAVSEGAHLAFAVMRDYPESVRSVVLDSAFIIQGDSPTTNVQVEGVDTPALVMVGEHDSLASSSWRRFLADRLTATYVFEFSGLGQEVGRGRKCLQSLAASFFQDPSARLDLGCVVSMAQSDIPIEEAALSTESEITFTIADDPDASFVGIVPEGWKEILSGVFAVPDANDVGMLQTALPLTSIEQVLGMIQLEMGLSNGPVSTGTLEANDLTWQLYEAKGLGLSLNVALAELDGVTYAVVLQDPAEEGSLFYDQVFLPAVGAFTPRP